MASLAATLAARMRRRPTPGGPPAPFVVGVGRSGTTLLRLMLDSHPQLAIPPETGFVPDVIRACGRRGARAPQVMALLREQRSWGDFDLDEGELERRMAAAPRLDAATALRALYGLYAEDQDKPRWGDKTPAYVKRMPMIERALPEARFIHVIRDGRDVALSRAKRAIREPAPPAARGRDLAQADPSRPRAGEAPGPLHRGPLRGPGDRHRGDAAAPGRRDRPGVGPRDACATTSARASAWPRSRATSRPRGRRPRAPAPSARAAHALAKEPPKPDRDRRLEGADERRRPRRLRARSPATCWPSWATRWRAASLGAPCVERAGTRRPSWSG